MKFLTGKDYEGLCPVCKRAIDDAYLLLTDDYDDAYTDDVEAPLLFAGDHGWLCAKSYCANQIEPPPKVRWVARIVLWEIDERFNLKPLAKTERAAMSYGRYDLVNFLNKAATKCWGDYHDHWTWEKDGLTLYQQNDSGPWTEITIMPEHRCPGCKGWPSECNCLAKASVARKDRAMKFAKERNDE